MHEQKRAQRRGGGGGSQQHVFCFTCCCFAAAAKEKSSTEVPFRRFNDSHRVKKADEKVHRFQMFCRQQKRISFNLLYMLFHLLQTSCQAAVQSFGFKSVSFSFFLALLWGWWLDSMTVSYRRQSNLYLCVFCLFALYLEHTGSLRPQYSRLTWDCGRSQPR